MKFRKRPKPGPCSCLLPVELMGLDHALRCPARPEIYPLKDFTPEQTATLARFEAAEPAPESYVRQHRMTSECWCGPEPVGFSGAWAHRKVDE